MGSLLVLLEVVLVPEQWPCPCSITPLLCLGAHEVQAHQTPASAVPLAEGVALLSAETPASCSLLLLPQLMITAPFSFQKCPPLQSRSRGIGVCSLPVAAGVRHCCEHLGCQQALSNLQRLNSTCWVNNEMLPQAAASSAWRGRGANSGCPVVFVPSEDPTPLMLWGGDLLRFFESCKKSP